MSPTTSAACGIACVRRGRPLLTRAHTPRVPVVSKVITLPAVAGDLESSANLAAASVRQATDPLTGFHTAQSPYGTDLCAAVASPESNVLPSVLPTVCHPYLSTLQSIFSHRMAVKVCSPRRTCPATTLGGPGTVGPASGAPRGPGRASRALRPSDGFYGY